TGGTGGNAVNLSEVRSAGLAAIASAASLDELRQIEADYLGKKSQLALLQRQLGPLEPDERRARGAEINAVRDELADAAASRRTDLAKAERAAQLEADRIDLTELIEPVRPRRGHLNLVTQDRDQLEDVFVSMGFIVA